ncbi:hypothetical protein BC936DRAFT_148983 [Jimgerdemannia flammicorona]|uniref:Transforming acidic coiled-coil-containing protein C-terminal domain-containing protein n=1 Tax=Jimgerdemannia flammicorona TaxID=994334 RepID=A0A433D1U1_9FUNG|nr:hypothetical protein BC936DRAFT_148983 [Jimgerdemannia flammicorona]
MYKDLFAQSQFKMVGAYPIDEKESANPVSAPELEKLTKSSQDQRHGPTSLLPTARRTTRAPLTKIDNHIRAPHQKLSTALTTATTTTKTKRPLENDWNVVWTAPDDKSAVESDARPRKRPARHARAEEATLLDLLPNTMLTPRSVPKYSARELGRVRLEKEKEVVMETMSDRRCIWVQIETIRSQLQERIDIELQEKEVMKTILDEFEKMLNAVHDDHEDERKEWERLRREYAKSKSDMEDSFHRLMKKYEKKKGANEQYCKNEELLRKTIDMLKEDAAVHQQRYEKLKSDASLIGGAVAEVAKERADNEKHVSKLEAQIKEVEAKVRSLELLLETKEKQLKAKGELAQTNEVKAKVQSLERQLEAKDKQLKAKDEQLLDKEKQLEAKEEQLLAKEEQLLAKDEQLLATEERLEATENQLENKEAQLRDREGQLRVKDEENRQLIAFSEQVILEMERLK